MKKLFILATAAVALASCSDSDLVGNIASSQQTEQPQAVEFGTYVGSGATRTGYENTTGMTTELLKNIGATSGGFGVFAYYTGNYTYGQQQKTSTYTGETSTATADIAPNFMYNQQVTWSTDHWTYAPLKYWPNDIANGTAVDDQTTDGAATGSATYGGNVSFFAYAPYVSGTLETDGITGMSTNTTTGDPTITYTIPSDINAGGAFVDLLWGTLSGTTENVLSTQQNGVTGNKDATDNTYIKAILDGETVNADLTKQKVDGTVGFAFKHALAKIGGYGNGTTTGFLVKLDIDNKNTGEASTAINGGAREEFSVSTDNDAWRTIVTIKSIEITNDLNGATEGLGEGVALGGTKTLNLATGQWSTPTGAGAFTQTIGANAATTYHAEISSKIAEMYSNGGADATWISKYDTKTDYFVKTLTAVNTGNHPGVTETAQSVYNATNQSPIILFPGTTPKFKITVDYVVRTYDANLSSKYSEVEQIISKVITFQNAVELNKHYSILMHLGLTSVKFTATVSDWDVADPDNDNIIEVEDAEDIHLPINVISSTEAVVPAGTNPTVYTAAGTTSYVLNMTGLTNGNKVYCSAFSGDGIANLSAVTCDPATIAAAGTSAATVTLTANASTTNTVTNTVTIVEYTDSDTDGSYDPGEPIVSTSVVTIVQNKKTE